MNLSIFFIVFILGPIPVAHILLHIFLQFWRTRAKAMYMMGVGTWIIFLPTALFVSQFQNALFIPPYGLIKLSLILILIWTLIVFWAMNTLTIKRFLLWAVVQPHQVEQKYVERGPYQYLPHPAYTAYMMISLFAFLATGYSSLLIFFVLFVFSMFFVIHLENKELHKRLQNS